ncbi:MAG: hypothetical protein ACHQPI_00570 [Thermoanaerobaculia bacterium]
MKIQPRLAVLRLPILCTASLLMAMAGIPARAGAQAPRTPRHPTTSAETPFAVEYYYKVKWGHADEFARLFQKNHLPILRTQVESGRILEIEVEKPRYHATEEGRWDYRVTLVFKSAAAAADASGEDALKKQLFPDQETYAREEQRRFEILLAHWDLPIVPAPEMERP